MYLFKLALRPWRLAPFSQMFSSLAVGILLLLIGFLFWMQRGLKPVLTRLQGEQVVTAYLDTRVSEKEAEQIVDSIRLNLGAHPNAEVSLIHSAGFIALVKKQYPDLGRELEDLGSEMDQIVPRYISVAGILPKDSLDRIRKMPGIESAESTKDRYQPIVGAFAALRTVARVLMAGICLALLTGLIHLARMNSYLHREAILLLCFWGAGSSTLILPGMVSGMLVGLLGGAIAFSGWLTAGAWLAQHFRHLSPILNGLPLANSHLAGVLLILGGALGWIAGVFGTLGNVGSASQSQALGGEGTGV